MKKVAACIPEYHDTNTKPIIYKLEKSPPTSPSKLRRS
jgi:hypothetical protein